MHSFTEPKGHLVTTIPVSGNYHSICRETNTSQPSPSPPKSKRKCFSKCKAQIRTLQQVVSFLCHSHFCHMNSEKRKQFDAWALARSHSFFLLPSCIKLCSPSWCMLLLSVQCGLTTFFHIIHMPLASHALWCWLLGPTGPQGESKMCHGDGGSPRAESLSSTCSSLPCPYIITLSIHTFSLVLSISFPINNQFFGCIFLSKLDLLIKVGFGMAGIKHFCLITTTGFSEDTTLLGLTLCLCLCVHPLSPQATLNQTWEVSGHPKVPAS